MSSETNSQIHNAQIIQPGTFEAEDHWYAKAFNSTIHPMVNFFLNLDKDRIVNRYCHLHPMVDREKLSELLDYQCKYFMWAGADLINVTSAKGKRQMVVIENNSCPSGQKSMPLRDDHQEEGSYRLLIERTFKPYLKSKSGAPRIKGALAVIHDKNPMETLGYAKVIADVFEEPVYYAYFEQFDKDPPVKFEDGVMFIRTEDGEWHQIRAAFRYVTQRPWNRIPLHTKTRILNPIIACLTGGRNKMVAAKAYDFFNADIRSAGLKIIIPETIWDVSKAEIPLWVKKMGGQAVIKIPYSNAGQGVFTIVNQKELDDFMLKEFEYERFIVQSLIGNYHWSSISSDGKFYHVGTMPNAKGNTYVFDLRMMVSSTKEGIRPLGVYSRRAAKPLVDKISESGDSWDILGTNLSIKNEDGSWDSDTNRLILTDRRDFNKLGIGLDDLIEAYIQTVLSTIAIDKMSHTLINAKGRFSMRLFKPLNDDQTLVNEIML
ncbi:MAG: hypothetical protein R3E32_02605 [Chitinophagales bacterium]